MARLTIDFPDGETNRILNAFASAYQYSATLPNGDPNPQTKAQFFKAQVMRFIKGVVKGQEVEDAAIAARAAAEAAADPTLT